MTTLTVKATRFRAALDGYRRSPLFVESGPSGLDLYPFPLAKEAQQVVREAMQELASAARDLAADAPTSVDIAPLLRLAQQSAAALGSIVLGHEQWTEDDSDVCVLPLLDAELVLDLIELRSARGASATIEASGEVLSYKEVQALGICAERTLYRLVTAGKVTRAVIRNGARVKFQKAVLLDELRERSA